MSESTKQPIYKKPSNPQEFIQCLICPGWNPGVVFYYGSKHCLNLKPDLVRNSITELSKHPGLSRYTYALTKIVRMSSSDEDIKREWKQNLPLLRALYYTSAFGTARQRAKLIEVSQNKQLVKAMRYALKQETKIEDKNIEGSWIAVLFAEGSKASVNIANRCILHIDPEKTHKPTMTL